MINKQQSAMPGQEVVVEVNNRPVSRPLKKPSAEVRPILLNCSIVIFPITTSATSQVVIPANPLRALLTIQNKGINAIAIDFDKDATMNNSLEIAAGSEYTPSVAPTNAIYIIGAVAGETVIIVEGTKQ